MVAISKCLEEPICRLHCSQSLFHPGEACLIAALRNLCGFAFSNGKFFLPLLISRQLLNYKTFNGRFLLNALKFYLQAASCGALSSWLIFSNICLFRNVLGKYYKYTVVAFPALCGSMLSVLYPPRVLNLFHTATTQAVFEVLIRQRSNFLSRLICDSKYLQTFLFMLNSALILHFKRTKFYMGFWFIQPNISVKIDSLTAFEKQQDFNVGEKTEKFAKCTHHEQSCSAYIFSGLKKYALIGIPLDLLTIILRTRLPTKTDQISCFIKNVIKDFQKTDFKMSKFFLSYIGIYRLTNCLLQRQLTLHHNYTKWTHLISSFFGGLAYLFLGNLNFFTLSLVLAIQITWQWFCSAPLQSNEGWESLKQLQRIKFAWMILPLNLSILLHTFVFRPHLLNSLSRGFINGTTNFKAQHIYDFVMSVEDADKILKEAKVLPKKIWF